MRRSLAGRRGLLERVAVAGALLLALSGCRRAPAASRPDAPPLLPPPSGTLAVNGLRDIVTVIRDTAGIPHITAANEDDLFFAQGFVQAQDRLFQMDLWRRSVQGRLSEVLGASFIERDAMTRRVQYRGPIEVEWDSYGPRTKTIAQAFTRGVNAWIERTQDDLPQEFALAGWKPEAWKPEDLLNRTDAFLASGDAQDEALRAQLIAALGAAAVDAIWPPPADGRTRLSPGVDLGAVNYTLGDLLRRVGTTPFFSALLAPVPETTNRTSPAAALAGWPASNVWAVTGPRAGGHALVAADPHRALTTPSRRYLVHLTGPGWNVIGATAAWLPGVAIGHNEAVAWAYAAAPVDVQDLFVEKLNPANERQVEDRGRWVDVAVEHDAVAVKGRKEPFEYDRLYTKHGVIIGLDRDRHLAYTLQWSGSEPGAAAELGAPMLGQASSIDELTAALTRWKLPPADFVFADRTGAIGHVRAALVPRRSAGAGRVPAAAWNGSADWRGWERVVADRLPPAQQVVAFANDNQPRQKRVDSVLATLNHFDLPSMVNLQQNIASTSADTLVPLLAALELGADAPSMQVRARSDLMKWDRRMAADSPAAALYAHWEAALRRGLVERRVPAALRAELVTRSWPIVPPLTSPTRAWFDGDPLAARDTLLKDALLLAAQERAAAPDRPWGEEHQALFTHPLAVTDAARRRFNVGPFTVPGYADTVFAVTRETGPALRLIMDSGDWDRSLAVNAPGQSESPRSIHFRDLADKWARGEYVPMPFSERAVQKAAAATLTLTPRR
jgi:penicillin amidase